MATTSEEIRYGSTGANVTTLQKLLNQAGYNLTVDGIFGANTQAAVKKYQQSNGLAINGIVDRSTWASILNGNAERNANNNAAINNTTSTSTKDTGFTYKDFSYKDYKESDVVKEAKAALDAQLLKKPGDYTSRWQDQLDDIYNKIMNREDFSYDFNQDVLYQQYKDKYIQQGKMAMADTMGQAAAMTGGYGNSYAQSVGQQAYNAQLQNLNDVIPELYQMAYDKHEREGEDLYNQYALTMEQEETDYGKYRDSLADWQTERDYLQGIYDSERDYDYGKYTDSRDFAYGQYADDKNYAYNEHRNAIADAQWQAEFEEAQRQYNESLAEQQRQYNESLAEQQRQYDSDLTYKKSQSSTSDDDEGDDPGNDTDVDDDGEPDGYALWSGDSWYQYFYTIRVNDGEEAAMDELMRMSEEGLIPKNYAAMAAKGARKQLGH